MVPFPNDLLSLTCSVERCPGQARCPEMRRRCQELERIRRAKETFFSVGDQPLEILGEFEYLVRVLDKSSSDWPALYANLAKARKCWGCFGRILGREGACSHIWPVLPCGGTDPPPLWVGNIGAHCAHVGGPRGSAHGVC